MQCNLIRTGRKYNYTVCAVISFGLPRKSVRLTDGNVITIIEQIIFREIF